MIVFWKSDNILELVCEKNKSICIFKKDKIFKKVPAASDELLTFCS